MTHIVRNDLLHKRVKILVIGAGGTGSMLATELARLQIGFEARGHLGGFSVVVADGDTVSQANVGRQIFYEPDIGLNKADVIVSRVNSCFGLNWESAPQFVNGSSEASFNIVISCVDSAKARREIHAFVHRNTPFYWLDMGNGAATGQVVMGEPLGRRKDWKMRLPVVTELYPQLLDESIPESNEPSCSLAEALEKQGLFINRAMAIAGLQMIEEMLRTGKLEHNAAFIDLNRFKMSGLRVDKETWAGFGYKSKGRAAKPY